MLSLYVPFKGCISHHEAQQPFNYCQLQASGSPTEDRAKCGVICTLSHTPGIQTNAGVMLIALTRWQTKRTSLREAVVEPLPQ